MDFFCWHPCVSGGRCRAREGRGVPGCRRPIRPRGASRDVHLPDHAAPPKYLKTLVAPKRG
eukprot:scaffold361975_cov26-Prasinocladus_malaysianus.AAC.1